jgi:type IV pilus assembly protein PilM
MAFGLSTLASLFRNDAEAALQRADIVGIDIGSSAIKVVQIKDVKGVPTLVTYGELQLGPYEGVDIGRTTHLSKEKLVEALVDIVREASVTGKDAIFALSYNASFMTTISVPTLAPEKISAMIPVEARKYIPMSLTKVTLNWTPLGVNEKENTTQVLLSVIYNETFSEYSAIIKESGLNIVGSEVEITSSVRAIVSEKDERVAIIDCGAFSTRVYIVEKGVVIKNHSILLSGNRLTQALTDELKIEFKEAEEIKRTFGLTGKKEDPRIQKILTRTLEREFRELHTVLKKQEESDGVPVQKIILSGGGALLLGLQAYVSDMFSRPVVLAEPFTKVVFPSFLGDTLKEAGPSFSVAIGGALQAFQNNQQVLSTGE